MKWWCVMGNDPVGTKIIFLNNSHNLNTLRVDDNPTNKDFSLGVVYEVGGHDSQGQWFYDGAGYKNYAGCDSDGGSGEYVVVVGLPK
ncbi:MAG: hypothetical protein ACXW1D_00805 [Halobacteriota archaeon]